MATVPPCARNQPLKPVRYRVVTPGPVVVGAHLVLRGHMLAKLPVPAPALQALQLPVPFRLNPGKAGLIRGHQGRPGPRPSSGRTARSAWRIACSSAR
jgi:hypothetical protein